MTETDSVVTAIEPITIGRAERWALAGVLLVGFLLRVWSLSSVQVEQFDEGVYASNRWFTEEEGARFPSRHLYAPPVWPSLLEASQLVLGTGAWGVMLPSVILGTLSLWFVWRLVRMVSGPMPALVATCLGATSEYHITYSRTALTDVPMTCLMLAGITIGVLAIQRESWRGAVISGAATGLAWSTKYNGWFPLAVLGTGIVAHGLFHVKPVQKIGQGLLVWLLVAITAVLVWLPVWFDLQSEGRGGYGSVQANHARYIEGLSAWRGNLLLHAHQLSWWESSAMRRTVGGLITLGAILGVGLARSRRNDVLPRAVGAGLMGAALLSGMVSITESLFALAIFEVLAHSWCVVTRWWAGHAERSGLVRWVVVVWFVSLLLVTPLYRAYPRLAMPWVISWWVLAGLGLQRIRDLLVGASDGSVRTVAIGCGGLLSLLLVSVVPLDPNPLARSAWQSRLAVESAASLLVTDCDETVSGTGARDGVQYVVYVLAEPALFHHLCRLAPSDVLVAPISNLGFVQSNQADGNQTVPIFLVVGPHSTNDETFRAERDAANGRLELLSRHEVPASDLVMMNLVPSFALSVEPLPRAIAFELYGLVPLAD